MKTLCFMLAVMVAGVTQVHAAEEVLHCTNQEDAVYVEIRSTEAGIVADVRDNFRHAELKCATHHSIYTRLNCAGETDSLKEKVTMSVQPLGCRDFRLATIYSPTFQRDVNLRCE
jgi:hypothetical protein